MIATSGNEIKLWDVSTQDQFGLVKEYQPVFSSSRLNTAAVTCFSVRPDFGQIASVVRGDSINITNTATHLQEYLKESSDDVTCCCYDSTGRYLAVGTTTGSLDIYDFNSNSTKRRNWKVNAPVSCLSWSKSDRHIALGSSNGSLTLFNTVMHVISKHAVNVLQNGTAAKANGPTNPNPALTALQYSTLNTSYIGCSYDDGAVLVWDSSKEKSVASFKSHSLPCTSFTFSPINNILMVSGGLDGLCCYDLVAKKVIKTVPCSGGISSLDMHTDGMHICVGTASGHLKMYDLRYLQATPYFTHLIHDTSVHCIKYLNTTNLRPSEAPSESFSTTMRNSSSSSTIPHHGSQQNYLNHTPESHLRVANSNAVKKSSSFDNQQQLSALANNNRGTYSIFSPDVTNPYQSSLNTNHSIPLHSTAMTHSSESNNREDSSFILHKKQTGPTTNGQVNMNGGAKAEMATPTFNNDSKQARMNKLRNDMFSPLNNTSPSNNTIVPQEGMLIAQFTQSKKINEGKRVSPSSSFSNASSVHLKNAISPKSSLSGITQQAPSNTQSSSSTSSQPTTEQTSPSLPTNGGLHGMLNGNHSNSSSQLAACANVNQTATLPLKQLEEAIKDKIDDFKDEMMSENFRFKAEMLKEFMDLKIQIQRSLEACSLNDELLKEIVKLREENKRLKKLF